MTDQPDSRAPGSLVADYDYVLPTEHIARYPADQRDESRVLLLNRATDETSHLHFRDLPTLFQPKPR